MSDLLTMFKNTIGDFSSSAEIDEYYSTFIRMAQSQLRSEDISETVLNGETGEVATVLLAEALMNKKSIADNPTITLLRSLLTAQTKGERHCDDYR